MEELGQAAVHVWKSLSTEYIGKQYISIPKGLLSVLGLKGATAKDYLVQCVIKCALICFEIRTPHEEIRTIPVIPLLCTVLLDFG